MQNKHAEAITVTRQLCKSPGKWFQRYPGKTPLGKSGCRFSSRLVGDRAYEVKSECALMKGGTGVARGVVKIDGSRAFHAEWEVTENKIIVYRERVKAVRLAACSE